MEELKHFSHEEHPLILTQADEADQSSNTCCYGCQTPILTKPSYKCRECNIFLHKRCAELPMELINHPLHKKHPLKLLARLPNFEIRNCQDCKQQCNGFIYHCSHCNDFNIHILCLFPEIQLEHPGHEHPLTLLPKKASFNCDACGTKEEELSYICVTCPFWIHKSCALLPPINHQENHEHPLSLAFSYPIDYRKYEIPCEMCFRKIPFQNWVYYCEGCRYFVHFSCVTRRRYRMRTLFEPFHYEDEKQDLIQLPINNFEQEIRRILEKELGLEILQNPKNITLNCCPHNIDLVDIQNLTNNSKNAEITCNRCMEPIDSLCYQCSECNYFFHLTCAQLPKKLKHRYYPCRCCAAQNFRLVYVPCVFGMTKCDACNLDCNGYFFRCASCYRNFDVKCAFLPTSISHKSHQQHPLYLTNWRYSKRCNSCGHKASNNIFACEACGFYLDSECVLLPKSVDHRWDKHALLLSYPPFSDRPGEFYCEICEEEIHPKRWHYHCRECDQSFHPRCIPRLGVSRNFSFGRFLEFGRHPHPLKLVREGEYKSSCDSCKQWMYGQRVFKCESCKFYICPECARKFAESEIRADRSESDHDSEEISTDGSESDHDSEKS